MRHFIEAVGDIDVRAVKHRHGEVFIQACLDRGNTSATANKKAAALKRVSQLTAVRGQLEVNPFRYVDRMKVPARNVPVINDDECAGLFDAAKEPGRADAPDYELPTIIWPCVRPAAGVAEPMARPRPDGI